MFEDYKTVFCESCKHSVFPMETYPWGTCCFGGKARKTITQRVPTGCNKYERKEKNYGKNK